MSDARKIYSPRVKHNKRHNALGKTIVIVCN